MTLKKCPHRIVRDDVKLTPITWRQRGVPILKRVYDDSKLFGRAYARCLAFVHSFPRSIQKDVNLSKTLKIVRNDGELHSPRPAPSSSTTCRGDQLLSLRDSPGWRETTSRLKALSTLASSPIVLAANLLVREHSKLFSRSHTIKDRPQWR